MRSHRPAEGSSKSPLCTARCARSALALWLAAGALAAVAPVASSDPGGRGQGGGAGGPADRVPPGQEKKIVSLELPPISPVVAFEPTQPLSNLSREPQASESSAPSDVAPRDGATPDDSAPAPVRGRPSRSAAPAARAQRPRPAQTPRSRAGFGETPGRRSRAPVPASTSGTRAAVAQTAPDRRGVAATTSATTTPAPARAEKRPAADSPLTRTVVRVLEVVPVQTRIALAVLAALGLLLACAAAVQTVRRRRLERQRRMLLADVGVLQSALLPELPRRIGGARVTAAYRPAEGLGAGGDFYDAFELPGGRTAVLVGDVAGHGRDVVPLTALVRYNLRAYLEAGLTSRATLDVAANVLAPQLGGRHVTIVVAIFDPGSGRLTYACAGHWPPLLLGTTVTPLTVCSSPPIGAGAPTGRRQTTIALAPGAGACFYTDGLGEVPVGCGRLGREGVARELEAVGPQGDAADLLARVVRRSERQPDDMAACMLTALPGGGEAWSMRLEELEVDGAALSGGWAEEFLVACGVGRPLIAKALHETGEIIGRAGTAVIEVRVGELLADVRVGPPPAVALPIARRSNWVLDAAATG